MRVLIDTHIFLWALSEPEKIPAAKRLELESEANIIFVSAISIAEIGIKSSLGKLHIPFDPVVEAANCSFEILDYTGEDAVGLATMPWHHRDPFDRMLIAQSISRRISIMTEDPKFKLYDCRLV